MVFAFTTRYADFSLNYKPQTIIGLLWVIWGLMTFAANGFKTKNVYSHDSINMLFWIILPYVVIHVYTILLMVIGVVSFSYFTTNLSVYIPVMMAVLSVYLFKEKALKYNYVALILSWLLSVVVAVCVKGLGIIPHAIIEAYVEHSTTSYGYTRNYLEFHDIIYATGYIFIYLVCTKSEKILGVLKNKKTYFIIAFIITFLGVKRIGLFALIVTIIFYWIISRKPLIKQYRICIFSGFLGIFLCYLFVYIVSSGVFEQVLRAYHINDSGRFLYLLAALQYSEFNVGFLGIGRNVLMSLFHTDLSYLNVDAPHSDIIKMYVENGFLMFGAWASYFLVILVKVIKNRFGYKSAVMYFCIIMYTFICYLTENNEIFFVSNIFLYSTVVAYCVQQHRNKQNGSD